MAPRLFKSTLLSESVCHLYYTQQHIHVCCCPYKKYYQHLYVPSCYSPCDTTGCWTRRYTITLRVVQSRFSLTRKCKAFSRCQAVPQVRGYCWTY